MKIYITLIAITCLCMTGCLAPNTTTHLQLNASTGAVSWSNPKDTSIASLSATISTNGERTLTVTGFSTLNNPAVITASGQAQANSITATGTVATQVINALSGVAGTAGAAALTK